MTRHTVVAWYRRAARVLHTVGVLAVVCARLAPPRRRASARAVGMAVRHAFAALGGIYLKAGQTIAAAPSVFGPDFSACFRDMLTSVGHEPYAALHPRLCRALGAAPGAVFASFDPEPIASASIAQVHAATLPSGQKVAVKIRHSGIEDTVRIDLTVLRWAVRAVGRALPALAGPLATVDTEFARSVLGELDFVAEGRSMQSWGAGLADTHLGDAVRVPGVHWQFTTEDVLVTDFVAGRHVADMHLAGLPADESAQLARTLLLALFYNTFRHGLVHGDMHGGNMIVAEDGCLYFIDFGVMVQLESQTRRDVADLFAALLLTGDFGRASRALTRLGVVGDRAEPQALAGAVERVARTLDAENVESVSFAAVGRTLRELLADFDIAVPANLVIAGKQVVYLESCLRRVAPHWQPINDEVFRRGVGGIMMMALAAK